MNKSIWIQVYTFTIQKRQSKRTNDLRKNEKNGNCSTEKVWISRIGRRRKQHSNSFQNWYQSYKKIYICFNIEIHLLCGFPKIKSHWKKKLPKSFFPCLWKIYSKTPCYPLNLGTSLVGLKTRILIKKRVTKIQWFFCWWYCCIVRLWNHHYRK